MPNTWSGVTNSDWGSPPGAVRTNWSTGFTPVLTEDVILNSSAVNDPLAAADAECKTLDCTDFAGFLDGGPLHVYGNCTFAPSMTTACELHMMATGTLKTFGMVLTQGVRVEAGTTTLDGDTYVLGQNVAIDAGCGLAMGTNKIYCDVTGDEFGLVFGAGSTLTFSAGAKLIGVGDVGSYLDVDTNGATVTAPPVELTGGAQLYMYPSAHLTSLVVVDGGVYFEEEDYYIDGDASFNGGEFSQSLGTPDMFGATLHVGGDLSIIGVGGEIKNGNLDVTGTATISGRTITNMTSTGPVDCTDGCTDGGGNDANFVFESADTTLQQRGYYAV